MLMAMEILNELTLFKHQKMASHGAANQWNGIFDKLTR